MASFPECFCEGQSAILMRNGQCCQKIPICKNSLILFSERSKCVPGIKIESCVLFQTQVQKTFCHDVFDVTSGRQQPQGIFSHPSRTKPEYGADVREEETHSSAILSKSIAKVFSRMTDLARTQRKTAGEGKSLPRRRRSRAISGQKPQGSSFCRNSLTVPVATLSLTKHCVGTMENNSYS